VKFYPVLSIKPYLFVIQGPVCGDGSNNGIRKVYKKSLYLLIKETEHNGNKENNEKQVCPFYRHKKSLAFLAC